MDNFHNSSATSAIVLSSAVGAGMAEAIAHFVLPPFAPGDTDAPDAAYRLRYMVGTVLWVAPALIAASQCKTGKGAALAIVATLTGAYIGTEAAYRVQELQDTRMGG